jgi:predicted Fe-Mo cluster-binding NifX family protein
LFSFPLKIAVPTNSPGGLDSLISNKFGKCEFLTLISLTNEQIESIKIQKNDYSLDHQDIGMNLVNFLSKEHVSILVIKNIGLNCLEKLEKEHIKILKLNLNSDLSIRTLMNQWKNLINQKFLFQKSALSLFL